MFEDEHIFTHHVFVDGQYKDNYLLHIW